MMDFTWLMILKMTGATLLYVAATALMWWLWRKRRHNLLMKVAVGLFYGLCSVISNHVAIDYSVMLLNVRDIGPLAAGLFFDPLSGVISGLIGGVERFLAGELWDIGSFTRVACSLSTIIAGFLAAAVHRWHYRGQRPPINHAFLLGAVMEVFHMYSILITHRDDMALAFEIVRVCSVPMILFTGVGLAGCSLVIRRMNGEGLVTLHFQPREKTPISLLLQRWLLVVVVFLFGVNFIFSSVIRQKMASQDAEMVLSLLLSEGIQLDTSSEDDNALINTLENRLTDFRYVLTLIGKDNQVLYSDIIYDGVCFSDGEIEMLRRRAGQPHFVANLPFFLDTPMVLKTASLRDGRLLIAGSSESDIYASARMEVIETILTDILLFAGLFVLISVLSDCVVVRNLASVVRSLRRITGGDLNEVVNVRSSAEFTELSGDINGMVTSLKGYIDAAEQRMKDELALAAQIQESALPRVFTFNRNDFEIYALMDPAKEVGGDFYDFFFIDTDIMALVIADVSGKGIPAAMFMMRSKTAIKNLARKGNSPAKLLRGVNHTLCEGNDTHMFVTVWIGIIDLRTGVMQCANAGHEYPVLKRAGGEYELLKDKHGLVLAVMDNAPLTEYTLQLTPGDRLFVYTDGVPEAINEATEQYGTDRLVQKLNTVKDAAQEQTLNAVRGDITAFVGAAEQFDDITMLGFTYNGPDQH